MVSRRVPRATDTSRISIRPAYPVPGGAVPQIVSIRPLQRVSRGGMRVAIVFALRSMAQTSDGRMEALQVMGQISEQQVQQLMKLRELMMADMSSKQSYQAAMIQKQAAGEAATERFFKWTPEVSDGTKFQSGWK